MRILCYCESVLKKTSFHLFQRPLAGRRAAWLSAARGRLEGTALTSTLVIARGSANKKFQISLADLKHLVYS